MEYETMSEINLASFDGHAFACIAIKQNEDRQRVLLLSKSQLIESIPNTLKPGTVIARDIHQLQGLSSIKFSRAQFGIIILQFKSGLVLQFKVKNAGQCADYIKNNMLAIGISGKVTKSKSLMDCIGSAEELLNKTKDLELEFSLHPSIELVQELMDGLREVVEKFDAANDSRYSQVIKQIQNFLARSDVLDVLDGKRISPKHKVTDIHVHTTTNEPSMDHSPNDISDIISTSYVNKASKGFPSEFKLRSPKSPKVIEEENNHEVEELRAMLGDITDEFNELIHSFGESKSKSDLDENSINLDDLDSFLSSSSSSSLITSKSDDTIRTNTIPPI